MAHQNGHLDRPLRCKPSKRVVCFIIACALLSLLWFNASSEGELRKTLNSLSKQTKKSAASAASAFAGDNLPDFDAQLHKVMIPSGKVSSPAPFPLLPPPDNEEYMAICMAG